MRINQHQEQIRITEISRIVGLFILLIFSLIGQSFAQEDTEDTIEEIVVTGSRIARDSNLTGALPVRSVDSTDIAASGEFSVSDTVNDIPALLSSITAEQSVDRAGRDGSNRLNLRGLGQSRTLVLVNGKRHVGGLQGSSSVDIGSVPQILIDRVEVLTGGASAVYGADAVTGVVNFILKERFDGLEFDVRTGRSEYGDAGQNSVSIVYGKNLTDGRSNITVVVDQRRDHGLKVHERSDGLAVGSALDWTNPALRFQRGDIGSATPNFARYYNYENTGLFHYGLLIPSAETFIANYLEEFGEVPNLTRAELALIERADQAPSRAALPFANFTITSGYGYIIPGNPFTGAGFDPETPIDLDGNGVPDCLDSFTGYNSVFGAASYGIVGGCWNVEADGSYRPIRDGIIASNFNGFGGDSFNALQQPDGDILLPDEKFTFALLGYHELSTDASLFGEVKHVIQENVAETRPSSFWDLLFGAPDNPFLPEFIRGVANETGGVAITIDPLLFESYRVTRRETSQIVAGLEGKLNSSWAYEVSTAIGRYNEVVTSAGQVIIDRFFAAIDAVTDPTTGLPVCRSELDPSVPAMNTPFQIPQWTAGYFSYTPGSGTCIPLNIWSGLRDVDSKAIDWVTTSRVDELTIEQIVFSAIVIGDSSGRVELPGGPMEFASGVEYRRESSSARFDDWQRGVLPSGSPFPAGTLISEVSNNGSLVFDPSIVVRNEQGKYKVTDAFLELSLPIAKFQPWFKELTLDVATRWSNYSTIGETDTWKANLVWSPHRDVTLRGGISQAVRAPNITELFGPETGATARPADPCDVNQINAIAQDNSELAQNYRNNCAEDFASFGLNPFDKDGNYIFVDPLSARFSGVSSGNPNLSEETADTFTYGIVIQPSFLPSFSLTVDYWDIRITEAIQSVTAQDIVNGCYRGESLNADFCMLFTRNTSPTSAQFGGFNFIRFTDINFAKLETDGVDVTVEYEFRYGVHNFAVSVNATNVLSLNNFTNPSNLGEVDVELGEILRPELAGNIFLHWAWGNLSVGWQSQYLGDMLLGTPRIEIDTAYTLFGDSVFLSGIWIHDLNARYVVGDRLSISGGINNMTHTDPFISEHAFPATPRGRMIFLGASYRR
ncbi:MAG: TonB-dependent receptor [Gammaproteobacteria bacterium]|nr:TonB-dependent receptor [Gammaproteobacteria bacterium]MDE0251967.1 TonB-dependent receptor [Gammaproteobacteria bacterium]MDE0402925.1 TonB-dependent receptor [Gammaproteobacteria bacterium]